MRRFELSDGTSDKFWEIGQDGCDVDVCYGRIGSAGTSQRKSHADPARATAAMDKLIREKTAKGYAETGTLSAPPATPAKPAPVPAPAPPAGDVAPWLASGAPIDMPAALAALALPSRRFPGPTPDADAGACWTLFRSHARGYVPVDPDNSHPPFRGGVADAVRRIEQDVRSGSAFSDVVLLALSTLFEDKVAPAHGSPFLNFLVADKGLPYAVEVLMNMEKISIHETTSRHGQCWSMTDDTNGWYSSKYDDFGVTELAMRAHLAHAPADIWEHCAQLLRAAIAQLPARRQPLCALLLPDMPALSDDLILALVPLQTPSAPWLRLTATSPASLQALPPFHPSFHDVPWNLYYNVPSAVASAVWERGVDAVDVLKEGAALDASARGLACIGTPEALRALALASDMTKKGPVRLAAAAQRWPAAAIAALAELLASEPKPPAAIEPVLLGLVRDHAAAVAAIGGWITAPAAKVLERLSARAETPPDLADMADVPPVLSSPPWLAPVTPAAKPLALAPLPLAPVERWTGEQRQQLRAEKRYNAYPYTWKRYPGPSDAAAAIAAGDVGAVVALWEAYSVGGYEIGGCVHAIADMPAPFNLAVWTAMAKYEINSPGYAIATFGLAGVPALAAMCEHRPAAELPYATHFGAVELAAPIARAYANLKNKPLRALARDWLLANPEHAACGLIAPALGKAGAPREAACSALRLLAANGHAALLAQVARRYGQDAVDVALRAMLDEDPLQRFPAKMSPLPVFWSPPNWARPRLAASGKALPDAALDPIGVMLRFPQGDGVYAGIDQLRQACTAESLAAFAWDLFGAWSAGGADSKENWAFAALRLFGNDDTARKLTPLIRAWPGESQHARAVAGLDVLAAIGTDTALMLLNGIAQKVKFKGLQDNARAKIGEIADARGLSTEELEDRLAPDLGLDDQGTLLLDFGARRFLVGFDETLKPYVRDQDGARLDDLPKPKKSDDPALSAAAVERYKLLKKDARTIAAQQVLRLELAMCAQRRWTPALFRTFLAGHPLVRHLVQRLVWGAYDVDAGTGHGWRLTGCFRVGPDGELTDANDDAFLLAEDETIRIGIPHALDLPASDSAAFGQLFADYELMQPFAQIGRDTYALDAGERGASALARWDGVTVPTGRVLGLANKGWRRGKALDGGGIMDFTKAIGGARVASLSLDPGIIVGMVDEYPEQVLGKVHVGLPGSWGGIDEPEPLSTLDPVAASELIRDLEFLRA